MSAESERQSQILTYLAYVPAVRVWRINPRGVRGRRATNRGMADIIGAIRPSGRFLAIEVKTPRGLEGKDSNPETQRHQELFAEAMKWTGALYIRATSVADVEEAFRREGVI